MSASILEGIDLKQHIIDYLETFQGENEEIQLLKFEPFISTKTQVLAI